VWEAFLARQQARSGKAEASFRSFRFVRKRFPHAEDSRVGGVPFTAAGSFGQGKRLVQYVQVFGQTISKSHGLESERRFLHGDSLVWARRKARSGCSRRCASDFHMPNGVESASGAGALAMEIVFRMFKHLDKHFSNAMAQIMSIVNPLDRQPYGYFRVFRHLCKLVFRHARTEGGFWQGPRKREGEYKICASDSGRWTVVFHKVFHQARRVFKCLEAMRNIKSNSESDADYLHMLLITRFAC
jgi:hypothetical protein